MKKRQIMTWLIALVVIIAAAMTLSSTAKAATVSQGTCGDNLTWVLDNDGVLTISGTGAMDDYDIRYPWEGDDFNSDTLKRVVINEGVTTIGDGAFGSNYELTSVDLPSSLLKIGDTAFCRCEELVSVDLPSSLLKIGDSAFAYTDITSIDIPDSVSTIENNAFEFTPLTSINIPSSVTNLGDGAFYYCEDLKNVNIQGRITKISSETFKECRCLTNVNIPDSVKSIGNDAFYGCTSLTSINIPDTVTEIGGEAFRECRSLKSIHIPDGVTEIWDGTFCDCSSLESVNIPDGVTLIKEYAFGACTSLTSITIPDGVKEIHDDTFSDCTSLKNVNIPDGVTKIGSTAFMNCTSLTTIDIPNSVTIIYFEAFQGCTGLKSITIPKSVTRIDLTAIGYAEYNHESYDDPNKSDTFKKIDGFVIKGYKGSAAETYAKEYGFKFYDLESNTTYDYTVSDAVRNVESMISALTNNSSEASVQAARKAYDALTANEKKQVASATLTKLTSAESRIAAAKKAAADKTAADKVTSQINGLGSSPSETTVQAARKAYNALTADQKKFVASTTLTKLTNAESKIAADKAAAKAAAEKAANITVDGVAVNLASAQTTDQMDKTITSRKSDADMSGSLYRILQVKVSSAGKTSNKVTWKKVSGADGYIVYGNKCGAKNSMTKLTTSTGTSFTHKKLKSGTYYKYAVVAYKNYNGSAKVIATSKTIHVATTGGKLGNPKKITTLAKKSKVSLKKGKTFKLGAKAVAQSKKLKVKKHRGLKYETSNAAVVTVSSAGKITAKGKGSCYVYVYAQNGVTTKISVNVK